MLSYLWPILLVVASNTLYNICAKSTSDSIQPFASLTLTYLVAGVCSLALFFATSHQKNLILEFGKANWATVLLGCVIVFLEVGWIWVYRAGWKLSVGSLVANAGLACVLLLVGVLCYRETVSLRQAAGLLLCMGGIFLLAK